MSPKGNFKIALRLSGWPFMRTKNGGQSVLSGSDWSTKRPCRSIVWKLTVITTTTKRFPWNFTTTTHAITTDVVSWGVNIVYVNEKISLLLLVPEFQRHQHLVADLIYILIPKILPYSWCYSRKFGDGWLVGKKEVRMSRGKRNVLMENKGAVSIINVLLNTTRVSSAVKLEVKSELYSHQQHPASSSHPLLIWLGMEVPRNASSFVFSANEVEEDLPFYFGITWERNIIPELS